AQQQPHAGMVLSFLIGVISLYGLLQVRAAHIAHDYERSSVLGTMAYCVKRDDIWMFELGRQLSLLKKPLAHSSDVNKGAAYLFDDAFAVQFSVARDQNVAPTTRSKPAHIRKPGSHFTGFFRPGFARRLIER